MYFRIRAPNKYLTTNLYKNEKHIKDHITEPLVAEFFSWVYEQRQRTDLTPKNQLTKALNYVNARQDDMKVFLANPNVAMDTDLFPWDEKIIYFAGVN